MHFNVKSSKIIYGIILLLASAAVIAGCSRKLISVSSNVNGKELPIYCVETDKPQIALTFDAAWGNG